MTDERAPLLDREQVASASTQPFATEAGAADAHLPPGPPPGPWRLLDRLVVLVFAVALVVPGVLLVAGVHAAQVENRPPRRLPALTAAGLLDATWPAGVDGFLTDHLAPRSYAVRIRGEMYWLTGGTGNPSVIRGNDGWLFFHEEFQPRCLVTGAQLGAALDAAAAALAARGTEFRFLLVPDKHSVYADKVPAGLPFGPSCEDTGRADLEAAIARLGGTAIDARDALLAARAAPDGPDLYYSQDTHWTPSGAAIAVGELVRSFTPNLWNDADVVARGSKRRVMDTATLLGLRRVARTPYVVLRPDIEQRRDDVSVPVTVQNARAIFRITSSGSQQLLPGRTLVIYDSFFGIDTRLVAPYFAETTWVHVGDLLNHPELVGILGPFDRVILERVERGFYGTDVGALLAPLTGAAGG
jgi:hypothetical protein